LTGEVVVDGLLGDVRRIGDLGDGHLIEAALGEQRAQLSPVALPATLDHRLAGGATGQKSNLDSGVPSQDAFVLS